MQLVTTSTPVTMTSVELVDYINSEREAGMPALRHDSFMVKVPKVLGVNAPKFIGTQAYGNNNTREIYTFPKREACLMAMSYSYDLQAKVYDKMTALEQQLPVVKDPVLAAHIATLMRLDVVQQEQQRLDAELARLGESVAVIEARTQPENKHFTVMGYANLVGQKLDFGTASKLGRKCAELSRSQGMVIGDVSDPRFGKVHSYHESVLKSVLLG